MVDWLNGWHALLSFIHQRMQVNFGSMIRAVGSGPDMGDWDPTKGLNMTWQEGDVWTAKFDVPVGESLKFKVRGHPCTIHLV